MKSENRATFTARVAGILNKEVKILAGGAERSCLPGSLGAGEGAPVVGDWLEAEELGNGQCRALRALPRKGAVCRGNRRVPGTETLIAANVQLLLAVVTADYLRNQAGFVEAALIAAKRSGVAAGVFVSKWDLLDPHAQEQLRSKLALYEATADFVHAGSTLEYQEPLVKAVRSKTVLVVGDRGCGKTSLIARSLAASTETEGSRERIASTHSSVLKVGGDTLWIDTPGFRDFALPRVTAEERDGVFPEIAAPAEQCYFSNCTHVHETDCQVLAALRKKEIRRERYDAYQKLCEPKSAAVPVPRVDYRRAACAESFTCKVCGTLVVPEGAGSQHRNHCPHCLSSMHVDEEPGDRACLCR
ncbi:MAG: GTPase RsgA, partial [Bacillota bacterium]